LFVSQKLAKVVVILFLGSQPFTTDFGSDLVPWPSAIVMPIIISIAYFSILQMNESESHRNTSRFQIYIGLLLPVVILTRIQVGVLLLIATLIAIYLSKEKFRYLRFFLGFFISTLIFTIYLAYFGWLKGALYDQVIFGSTYLSADRSTFPQPIFTIIGIIFFCAMATIFPRILKNLGWLNPKKLSLFFIAVILSTLLVGIFLFYSRSLSVVPIIVVISRRFWISFSLACLLILLAGIVNPAYRNRRFEIRDTEFSKDVVLLLFFAFCFQSQIYPLFDQMHFWWGSPLTFLVMVIVWKKYFEPTVSHFNKRANLGALSALFLLTSTLVPWVSQISQHKEILPIEVGSYLYAAPIYSQSENQLQDFFHANIEKGTRVLNLCDNANIFFEGGRYIPASRFFVFWGEQMSHAAGISKSFLQSNPDVVLTCGLTQVPSLRSKQEAMQQSILKKLVSDSVIPIVYDAQSNKVWKIYRISKKSLI
jgi:hypothetical protein